MTFEVLNASMTDSIPQFGSIQLRGNFRGCLGDPSDQSTFSSSSNRISHNTAAITEEGPLCLTADLIIRKPHSQHYIFTDKVTQWVFLLVGGGQCVCVWYTVPECWLSAGNPVFVWNQIPFSLALPLSITLPLSHLCLSLSLFPSPVSLSVTTLSEPDVKWCQQAAHRTSQINNSARPAIQCNTIRLSIILCAQQNHAILSSALSCGCVCLNKR